MKLLLRLFSVTLYHLPRGGKNGAISYQIRTTTFPEAALRLSPRKVCLSRWFDLNFVRNQVGLGKAAPKHDPLSIKCKQTHYCGMHIATSASCSPHSICWRFCHASRQPLNGCVYSPRSWTMLLTEPWIMSRVQPNDIYVSTACEQCALQMIQWIFFSHLKVQKKIDETAAQSSCQGLYWVVLVCLAIDHTVFSKTDGSAHLYSGKINGTPHLAEKMANPDCCTWRGTTWR